jgi:hypothetical protein
MIHKKIITDKRYISKILEISESDHFADCIFVNCHFHGYGAIFFECKFFSDGIPKNAGCIFLGCHFEIN